MKRTSLALLLMVVALLFSVQVACATPLPVKIVTNDLFADGKLYPFSPLGTLVSVNDGVQDSWAVARISEILADVDGNGSYETTLFNNSTSPYELTVYTYGFDDKFVANFDVGAPSVQQVIRTVGGIFEIYQDYAKNYDPTAIGTAGAGATAASILANTSSVTDGTLWLKLQGVPTIGGYTLNEALYNDREGYSGNIYLDVIGGSEQNRFNTNTQSYSSDVFYSFSAIVLSTADGVIGGTWDTFDDGTGITATVPEPGTLLLLGMGLIGVGLARRYRRK